MQKYRGYVLAEVLLSLLLVASISLLLLKQQWQNAQISRQILTRLSDLNSKANQFECRQGGFILGEVIIGLVLSGLIMLTLVEQYANIRRQINFFQTRLDRQLDIQYVADILRKRVRNAGFTPCANLHYLRTSTASLKPVIIDKSRLTIIRMSSAYMTVNSLRDELRIPKKFNLADTGKLIIADCYQAHIFSYKTLVNKQQDKLIRLDNFSKQHYQGEIYIGELIQDSFWVNNNSKLLYRSKRTDKLIDNVVALNVVWKTKNHLAVSMVTQDVYEVVIVSRVRSL